MMTTKQAKLPTYAQAKQVIWKALEDEGWTMSNPRLKIPHATNLDSDRIWFRPQAIYLNAHSLHIDIRQYTPQEVIQDIYETIDSRRNWS